MEENKKAAPEDNAPMEKRPKISSARSKRGMYTAAISALVVAIVIVFNLAVGSVPEGTLEYDISGRDLYNVTSQSSDYLKKLDKDVSVIVLSQESNLDKHVDKFIHNYARLSSHIKLQIVDPVLDPTVLTTYSAKEGNIIVKCDATNKTKMLNVQGFQGYTPGLVLYDPQAYQYYGQLKAVALDAEGQLTSAVSYVTSTSVNKLYLLSGHGEASLGANAADAVVKVNIQSASLNLLTASTIPADCQLLVCNNPTKDLTGDELNTLQNYLRTGGKLLLILDSPKLTNFNALLAVYGLQMQPDLIGDKDRYNRYAGSLYQFLPVLPAGSDVTTEIGDQNVLVHNTRGMLQVTPERRGATVTPLLTTSSNGFLANSQSKNDKYVLGAVVTETFTDKPGVQTRFTVLTSLDILADNLPQGLSNMDIFTNAVVKNYSDVTNVSVPSKSLDVTPITVAHPLIWAALFVAVIPLGLIIYGFINWINRRKR